MSAGVAGCGSPGPESEFPAGESVRVRVATFNIEDLRGDELQDPAHPRVRAAIAIVRELGPDILLVNEIAFDQPGSPGWSKEAGPGANGRRLAESLEPLAYRVFTAPVNTGVASGFDLDNDGGVVAEAPALPAPDPAGGPARQTAEGRAYGADAWGFGTFPGQYGMALLVRDGLEILEHEVRTFQQLPWSDMPDALAPVDPETGEAWYGEEEWARFRLSSKSHWDVPVRLPNGVVLHVLASHPTPPAFDGPEARNKKRNHDEIRFWAEYLNEGSWIVDDRGRRGGLDPAAAFVIVGDLNADPEKGASLGNPIGRWLLDHPRVDGSVTPTADAAGVEAFPDLAPSDTASWGFRVDYVLPSAGSEIVASGVRRPITDAERGVSDHFPVWLDLVIRADRAGED